MGGRARSEVVPRNSVVTGLSRDERGIAGVETSGGPVANRKVGNCAEPGRRASADMAASIDREPLRSMMVPANIRPIPHSAL